MNGCRTWIKVVLIMLIVSIPLYAQINTADVLNDSVMSGIGGDSVFAEVDSIAFADTLPLTAVDNIVAHDSPHDAGGIIELYWTLSRADVLGQGRVSGYQVLRSEASADEFRIIARLGPGTDRFVDTNAPAAVDYKYIIRTLTYSGDFVDSEVSPVVSSSGQWFRPQYIPIIVAIVVIAFLMFITRRLPVMDEIWIFPSIRNLAETVIKPHKEPLVYVPGTGSYSCMATIASITLMEQLIELMREHDNDMEVNVSDPMTFSAATECLENLDHSTAYFISPDKAVFSMAYTHKMLTKPIETAILMGTMDDESLLLTEAGSRAGAFQIAGTDNVSQIPFLLSTCELTLIGEVLFLAGPQLSPDGYRAATLLHDRLKRIAWILLLLGILGAKLGWDWYIRLFETGVR